MMPHQQVVATAVPQYIRCVACPMVQYVADARLASVLWWVWVVHPLFGTTGPAGSNHRGMACGDALGFRPPLGS
jgi:hypothetical protein